MEKNHICKKCGGIAGWDPYFQSWICTRCGNTEPKPITNANRIRAMSDEELADFLWSIGINPITGNCYLSGKLLFFCGDGNGWLDWLKQEVKDNE